MHISYLSELLVLADTRNFTEAAKKCHISQSSLSKHISSLEHELGVDLLVRPSNPIKLTKAGSFLVRNGRMIVNDWEDTKSQVRKIDREDLQVIRLGYFIPAARWVLADIHSWARRNRSNEKYQIKPISLSLPEIEVALKEKRIDAAITLDPSGNLSDCCDHYNLKDERLLLAISKKNPLSKKDVVTVDDLKDQNFFRPPASHWPSISKHLDAIFGRLENYANAQYLDDVETILMGVEGDMAVAMVLDHNRSNFGDRIRFIDVQEEVESGYKVGLGLYWLREIESSVSKAKQISYLRKLLAKILK